MIRLALLVVVGAALAGCSGDTMAKPGSMKTDATANGTKIERDPEGNK